MKSILVGLLIASLIRWYPGYTQTDDSIDHKPSPHDPVYCLPISQARLLVQDAVRLRMADSLMNLQSSRIVLLTDEKQSLISSYSNLLKIESEKYQKQKEITAHMESLANSFRDERDYYQKAAKKQRRQKGVLTAGLIGVIVLMLVK